jgi:hypothetical protein
MILWGDSHARALKDELHKEMLAQARSGIFVDGTTCIRTPGIYPQAANMQRRAARCEEVQDRLFAYLKQQSPSEILVSMRWTLRLYPFPGAGERVGFDNGEGGRESETPRTTVALDSTGAWSAAGAGKAHAIEKLLDRLAGLAPVTVLGPVPEVGWHVGNTNFKIMRLHGLPKPDINTSFERFQVRNQFILDVLGKATRKPGIRVVWPHQFLCDGTLKHRCIAQADGTAFYSDDDHLSDIGARLMLDAVFQPR